MAALVHFYSLHPDVIRGLPGDLLTEMNRLMAAAYGDDGEEGA